MHPHRGCAKWYIELPGGTYRTFNQMVLVFLNHFQLSVHYDVDIELLSTLCQDKSTHILIISKSGVDGRG
jgi:hypothetical protein